MSAAPCRWPYHGKRRSEGGSAGKGGLGSLIIVMMSLLLLTQTLATVAVVLPVTGPYVP